ncbi:MAG: LysE family translocator [Candidatus Methanomethyliaceae archaeon]|nr:LysE family translocator [Candidatus Methanomethyliaceae archaeon]
MAISWAEFLPMVVVISASGVMSPGPLTFATIASGSKNGWRAGPSIGLGHLIVELPLVFAIAMGSTFISSMDFRWVSLGGGLFMVIFGFLTVRGSSGAEQEYSVSKLSGHPVMVGVGLSSLNPYFLLWWATVGAPLVIIATEIAGMFGVSVMFASHIWLDFLWLTVLALLGARGKKLGKFYPYFVAGLGVVLMAFGIIFIVRAFYGIS